MFLLSLCLAFSWVELFIVSVLSNQYLGFVNWCGPNWFFNGYFLCSFIMEKYYTDKIQYITASLNKPRLSHKKCTGIFMNFIIWINYNICLTCIYCKYCKRTEWSWKRTCVKKIKRWKEVVTLDGHCYQGKPAEKYNYVYVFNFIYTYVFKSYLMRIKIVFQAQMKHLDGSVPTFNFKYIFNYH